MIVNHFNTFPYGGAAAAATRIHRELLNQDVNSRFVFSKSDRPVGLPESVMLDCQAPSSKDSGAFGRLFHKRRIKRIHKEYDRFLAKRDPSLELFSMAELEARANVEQFASQHQIVHLHWVAFMADYPSFFRTLRGNPVVWTLHDMNPMTGGCHYSNGCLQFQNGCGNCPQLRDSGPGDLSRTSFRIKKNALNSTNLAVVTPSRWMLELAKSSPLFPDSTRFQQIRLGFDLDSLSPIDKRLARRELDIPTDRVVVGFGAESIANNRKGFDLLLQALGSLKSKDVVECFVFGSGELPADIGGLPSIQHFGFIDDVEKQRNFFSACDLVVVPSREDNQPQVGLEAMACGTPVVAFDVGGISEYVVAGKTGMLAKPECYNDLATQVDTLVEDEDLRRHMSSRCRKFVEKNHDIVKQAEQYISLYQSMAMSNVRAA